MLHKSGFSLINFQLLNLLIMNSNGLGSSKPKKGLMLATVIDVMTS